MAKKDTENFDFETESEGKGKFDLVGFFKNLTKQQKGIILATVVGIVVVIAIVVTVVLIGTNNENNGGNTNDDTPNVGDNDDEDRGEVDLEAEPTQIYVATVPNKTTYYVGETPNYSGLSIGVMEENSSGFKLEYDEYAEHFTITGFDSSVPVAEQTITVKYKEYETSFTIEIKELITGARLTAIRIDPLPNKTTYKLGEAIDYTGGRVLCEYSDGSTKTVRLKEAQISGFATITSPGEYEILVEYYDENGGYAKTTFTITMTE